MFELEIEKRKTQINRKPTRPKLSNPSPTRFLLGPTHSLPARPNPHQTPQPSPMLPLCWARPLGLPQHPGLTPPASASPRGAHAARTPRVPLSSHPHPGPPVGAVHPAAASPPSPTDAPGPLSATSSPRRARAIEAADLAVIPAASLPEPGSRDPRPCPF